MQTCLFRKPPNDFLYSLAYNWYMKYNPKGAGEFDLDTVVLDLNGTLAVNGLVPDGVKEKIAKLKELGFKIYLFSGDQRGNAQALAADLGIELQRASTTEEKEALTRRVNDLHPSGGVVSIGNARIDIGTLGTPSKQP